MNMNELMINTKAGWFYFETEKDTIESAFRDFEETCYNNRINIDNFWIIRLTLRDSNGNEIGNTDYV